MADAAQGPQPYPVTQEEVDPRREGRQNSGFTDDELSDIVCLLYPVSEQARIRCMEVAAEGGRHLTSMRTARAVPGVPVPSKRVRPIGKPAGEPVGDHAIVFKLSSQLVDKRMGFVFGRYRSKCDFFLRDDDDGLRIVSNTHFRIFIGIDGIVMLEDLSMNGTILGDCLYRRSRPGVNEPTQCALTSGSNLKILLTKERDIHFLVRIPRRTGEIAEAYKTKLEAYMRDLRKLDPNRTIGPDRHGHLFGPRLGPGSNNSGDTVAYDNSANESNIFQSPPEWQGGDKYNKVKIIGKGAFAVVWQVRDKQTGQPYAAKELDTRRFLKDGVVNGKMDNEMKIMRQIRHPNIVKYIEHVEWDRHALFIIMEYVQGGDLQTLVVDHGPLAEEKVQAMARQLLDALDYLHRHNITHRDVKPDNILVDSTRPDFHVKLTDFGLSKMIDHEQTFMKTFCGTLFYCAPEVYQEYSEYDTRGRRTLGRQKGHSPVGKRYGNLIDLWSLGGVFFFALARSPPYRANCASHTEILNLVMTTELDTQRLVKAQVSGPGIHAIKWMMQKNPEHRATVADMQQHPWLAGPDTPRSPDQISDDGLEQSASQLSLTDEDRQRLFVQYGNAAAYAGVSQCIDGKHEDYYTSGQQQVQPLWGAVRPCAMGSNGPIPEPQFHHPMPANRARTGLGDASPNSVDTFTSEEYETAPQYPPDASLSTIYDPNASSRVARQSASGSQLRDDAGGSTEFVTRAAANPASSGKRKPLHDEPDEPDEPALSTLSSLKRHKSENESQADSRTLHVPTIDNDDEWSLLASIPRIKDEEWQRGGPRTKKVLPKTKKVFWNPADLTTFHLNYPEMTVAQFRAFCKVAGPPDEGYEAFRMGKPVWNLAMKFFPPTSHESSSSRPTFHHDTPPVGSGWTGQMSRRHGEETASASASSSTGSVYQDASTKRTVAALRPTEGSMVEDFSLDMTDPVMTRGGVDGNIVQYDNSDEVKEPRLACTILVWRKGYKAIYNRDYWPWQYDSNAPGDKDKPFSDPSNFHFYISTQATGGLHVNDQSLPTSSTGTQALWMRLYDGDIISFRPDSDAKIEGKARFQCFWRGCASSMRRPEDEVPTPSMNRTLDQVCKNALEARKRYRIDEAERKELRERASRIYLEEERSRIFEAIRCEAEERVKKMHSPRQGRVLASRAKDHRP